MKDGNFMNRNFIFQIFLGKLISLSVNVKVEWLPANIAAKVTLLISIGKHRDSTNDWRGKTSET